MDKLEEAKCLLDKTLKGKTEEEKNELLTLLLKLTGVEHARPRRLKLTE